MITVVTFRLSLVHSSKEDEMGEGECDLGENCCVIGTQPSYSRDFCNQQGPLVAKKLR